MAKPITVQYRNTFENVYKAALMAVSTCEFSIGATNKDTGVIAFETGFSGWSWAGQKMYILVMESDDSMINVTIGGIRKSHGVILQIYDWGEAANIGTRIHKQIDIIVQSFAAPS